VVARMVGTATPSFSSLSLCFVCLCVVKPPFFFFFINSFYLYLLLFSWLLSFLARGVFFMFRMKNQMNFYNGSLFSSNGCYDNGLRIACQYSSGSSGISGSDGDSKAWTLYRSVATSERTQTPTASGR